MVEADSGDASSAGVKEDTVLDEESSESEEEPHLEGDDETETVLGPDPADALAEIPVEDEADRDVSVSESMADDELDEVEEVEEFEEDVGLTAESDEGEEILEEPQEIQEEEEVEEEPVEFQEEEEPVEFQEEEEPVESQEEEEASEEEANEEEVSEASREEIPEETDSGDETGQDKGFSLAEATEEMEEEKPARWTLSLPSAKLGWVATFLLGLSLVAGVVGPTDWWEYKWFDLKNNFRLMGVGGEWRVHPFGMVLVVQGRLTNTDRMTQGVPKIRVSLLDQENQELVVSSVLPGRIIDEKLLDDSTASSLQAMINLQSDVKKVKVEKLWPGKEISFQAIFINPSEKASRYRVDFDAIDKPVTGAVSAPGS